MFGFTTPLFASLIPWLLVLLGQQLALCRIIHTEYSPFYLVILGNLATASLLSLFFPRKRGTVKLPSLDPYRQMVLLSLLFYLCFQAFQGLYFRGFPLLWLLMGDGRAYLDFGVQSLNGLFNACYLISSTAQFLMVLEKKRRFDRLLFAGLLFVPVLVVSRQLLMSLFIQMACCYLFYFPQGWKKIAMGGVLLLSVFVGLGNLRTGVKEITQILGPEEVVPESLYSLLWIYAYCITPFNNINAACEAVVPVNLPVFELTALLPSFLRGGIEASPHDAGFRLVHKNLTVSTFYLPLLLDFGLWYCFGFMFVFQCLLYAAYRKAALSHGPIEVMRYAVLYMVMVLSIFSNLLLFLPVLFQLVILHLFRYRVVRRMGQVIIRRQPLDTLGPSRA